eukprot:1370381-Amorphochlora_amoeboformis.AAC.1
MGTQGESVRESGRERARERERERERELKTMNVGGLQLMGTEKGRDGEEKKRVRRREIEKGRGWGKRGKGRES